MTVSTVRAALRAHRFRLCSALFAAMTFATPLSAQVVLDNTIGRQPVCTNNGAIFTSGVGDCNDDGGEFQISGISVGPAGSTTTLDGATGNVAINGTFTANKTSTFNSGVTVNNGNVNIAGGDLFVGDVRASGFGSFGGGLVVLGPNTVDMGNNRVQGVAAPVEGTDAANKNYVDGKAAGQQTQINEIVTVNNAQQSQINSQGEQIGSLETQNAQQQASINELFVRDEAQQSQIKSLQSRDDELAEGIALALSLDAPVFQPGQNFAMRAGWGNFDGANAFGVTAAGVLDRGSFGQNSSVVLDGGVGFGTSQGTVAGKAGLSFGW